MAEIMLPALALGIAAWALPRALHRRMPDTQRAVAVALALSLGLMAGLGAGIFALLYALRGVPPEALGASGAFGHFVRLGLYTALIWLPILLLSALGLARAVEDRRGRRMAARDGD